MLGTPKSSTYPGSMPVVGNFDGPGASEFGVFDILSGKGRWTLTPASEGVRTVAFDAATTGDIPELGDYDGMGYDEFAVYRPSTGQFLVLQAPGTVTTLTIPGLTPNANLVPVPAQYDNQYYFDHNKQPYKTEAAVFDPGTGVFTIAGPTGAYTVTFQAGDIPVSADYAGTGSIQAAVFRPGTKQFIEKSGEFRDREDDRHLPELRPDFGRPGDRPAVLPHPQQLRSVDGTSPTPTPTPTPTPAPTPTSTPTPTPARPPRPRHRRSSHRRCRSPPGAPCVVKRHHLCQRPAAAGSSGRPLRARPST